MITVILINTAHSTPASFTLSWLIIIGTRWFDFLGIRVWYVVSSRNILDGISCFFLNLIFVYCSWFLNKMHFNGFFWVFELDSVAHRRLKNPEIIFEGSRYSINYSFEVSFSLGFKNMAFPSLVCHFLPY